MTKKSNGNEFSSAFIIPYYSNESEESNGNMFIDECLEGLFSQTDVDWSAIIVADTPHKRGIKDYLSHLKLEHSPKIDVIFLERNVSPGLSQ